MYRRICGRVCSILGRKTLPVRNPCCLYSAPALTGNLFKSPHPDLDLKYDSLPSYMFSKMDQYKNKTAVIDTASGRTFTFSQVKEYAIKVASGLRKLGYQKGDVIAIHATNCAEYAILLLAIPAAGLTITATNPAFQAVEVHRCLDMTNASCVITISSLLPVVESAVKSSEKVHKSIKHIITIDSDRFTNLMEDNGSAFPENLDFDIENDLVALAFSSGTTGLPKAVMLNHRSLVGNMQQMQYSVNTTPDDNFIAVLPFYHAYGMSVISFYAMQGGNKLVTIPKFDPEVFLQSIQDEKISYLHLVPPVAVFLAKHPLVAKYDLSSVQRALTGAAPLGDTVQEEFIEKIGIQMLQGFGMTEFGPGDVIDTVPPTIGTCGKLVPNTWCKFVYPGTEELVKKLGEPGELCLKGPQLMKGYLNDPEATNNTVRDGWIHTGDIGYAREDGNIVITDRVKDLIKYKAMQIAPAELENIFFKHPEVQDAAVIGIPDDRAGEVPRANIVRKPNCNVKEEELHQFVKENAADFKQIRGGIEIVDAIPKTPSGKILKRQLKDEFLRK